MRTLSIPDQRIMPAAIRFLVATLAVQRTARRCRTQDHCFCVQGHFQIMFSWAHCPLFQSRLPIIMRLMYLSGVWSYVVGAISTPLFIIVPILTIW